MKILVVDDSKAMRMIVQRTLRQAGYGDAAMTEAANGKEALDVLRRESFDVVLSDWDMPEMSGIQLLEAVRAEKIAVRFGFVTSEGTTPMREQAAAAGALFLVAKPFTVESFQDAMKTALG